MICGMRIDVEGEVGSFFAGLPQVEAVALSGSCGSGRTDEHSDMDFYVYIRSEIPVELRKQWIEARASRFEINNRFWETGDEWIEVEGNRYVDVMYRDVGWMEDQIARVLLQFQPSVGYSTCLWSNLLNSVILYDRRNWLRMLQESAQRPYPDELRNAIVRKNYPLLRSQISSYMRQIEKAIAREDAVSLNHRVTAFLASYFDILFALNRMPHPGEKRQLSIASRLSLTPFDMHEQIETMILAPADPEKGLEAGEKLIEGLNILLQAEGFVIDSPLGLTGVKPSC